MTTKDVLSEINRRLNADGEKTRKDTEAAALRLVKHMLEKGLIKEIPNTNGETVFEITGNHLLAVVLTMAQVQRRTVEAVRIAAEASNQGSEVADEWTFDITELFGALKDKPKS